MNGPWHIVTVVRQLWQLPLTAAPRSGDSGPSSGAPENLAWCTWWSVRGLAMGPTAAHWRVLTLNTSASAIAAWLAPAEFMTAPPAVSTLPFCSGASATCAHAAGWYRVGTKP